MLKPLWAFRDWLETECFVDDVWLPSIELKTDIRVKRFAFIKICGNIGKHNFARLSRVVVDICGILEANGNKVSVDQGYRGHQRRRRRHNRRPWGSIRRRDHVDGLPYLW